MDSQTSLSPVIGISSFRQQISIWQDTRREASFVPQTYLEKIFNAGGIPLIIPPCENYTFSEISVILAGLDGMLLTGGEDINPAYYGQEAHSEISYLNHYRDKTEIALANVTLKMNLPILGICRGMQVLAVSEGGTLNQHLPDCEHSLEHGYVGGEVVNHRVKIATGSVLASIYGEDTIVHSFHHQAVTQHPNYRAVAWAEDGTIEAIEHNHADFRVGVQWHPERVESDQLLSSLVTAAQKYRLRKYVDLATDGYGSDRKTGN